MNPKDELLVQNSVKERIKTQLERAESVVSAWCGLLGRGENVALKSVLETG